MTETKIITLSEPLPCALLDAGQQCGRPATVAYLTPNPSVAFPNRGTWILQPVCKNCAMAMAAIYDVVPSPGRAVDTARAKEIAAEYGWQLSNRTAVAIRNAARRGDIEAMLDEYGRWLYMESSLRAYLSTHHPRGERNGASTPD